MRFNNQKINLSQGFASQTVWHHANRPDLAVSFIDDDIGFFDDETASPSPLQIPSKQRCYLRLRYEP
jgi:hypothetical protein